jgi:hypothetical protein
MPLIGDVEALKAIRATSRPWFVTAIVTGADISIPAMTIRIARANEPTTNDSLRLVMVPSSWVISSPTAAECGMHRRGAGVGAPAHKRGGPLALSE